MDILVVVPTQLLLLLNTPAPQRLLHIPILVLATDHEADLAARVRGYGGVGIFDGGKDLFAGFLQVGDEGEVEPLVFGWYNGQYTLIESQGMNLPECKDVCLREGTNNLAW